MNTKATLPRYETAKSQNQEGVQANSMRKPDTMNADSLTEGKMKWASVSTCQYLTHYVSSIYNISVLRVVYMDYNLQSRFTTLCCIIVNKLALYVALR